MTIFQELESAMEQFHQGKITPKELILFVKECGDKDYVRMQDILREYSYEIIKDKKEFLEKFTHSNLNQRVFNLQYLSGYSVRQIMTEAIYDDYVLGREKINIRIPPNSLETTPDVVKSCIRNSMSIELIKCLDEIEKMVNAKSLELEKESESLFKPIQDQFEKNEELENIAEEMGL